MKHCRKMVLVNYDQEVEKNNKKLNDKQTIEILPNINYKLSEEANNISLSLLDGEMSNILKQNDLSDNDKWKLYSQVLERYLFHIRNKRQSEEKQEKQFYDILNQFNNVNSLISKVPTKIKKQNKKENKTKKFLKNIASRRNNTKNIVQNTANNNSVISVYSDASENIISNDEDESDSEIEIVEGVSTSAKNKSPAYEYRRDSRGRLRRNTLAKTAETISNNLENYNFKNWENYNRLKNELNID